MGQMAGGQGANQGSGEAGGGGGWEKLLMGGVKGGLSGFSDMQKQNQALRQGGPPMQVPMAQQPQVQLPMGNDPARKPNPYFYGYNGGGQ